MSEIENKGISRRDFLKDASLVIGGAAIGSVTVLNSCSKNTTTTATVTAPPTTVSLNNYVDPYSGKSFTSADLFKKYLAAAYPAMNATLTSFTINGNGYTLANLQPNWSLAYVMREKLNLVGTKRGCDMGECGVCTIIMNNRPVFSCITLAVEADGATIQTIEGLDQNGTLDPIQQAFINNDASQCGFCTPGQIVTARALLNKIPSPTAAQVKQALAGNLCRCSCYTQILAAVLSVGH